MMEWIKADECKPEAQKMVFVTVKNDNNGHRYTTTAMYIPPRTVLAENFLSDEYSEGCEEYDEERNCCWVVEAWFEEQTVPDMSWRIYGTITHWAELPLPAEE